MFDLAQLRCFVALAQELHFGRAAARLNMTQPPLSRQIQVLERILDTPLFDRTSRVVRLTHAGRSFLPEAKRILRLAEGAAVSTKRIASGKTGVIKIGFTAASAYSFLPRLVLQCRSRLPDIDLSLEEMVTNEQLEALAAGRLDIGLVRLPFAQTGLNAVRVLREALQLALPTKHALARKKGRVSLKDLSGQPFIMYAPYEARYFHDLLVAQFAKAKISPDYVQYLSQIHSILALVRAGLGIALVPESAVSLHYEGVVLRPLALKPKKPVELFMAWQDSGNPVMPRFLEHTQQFIDR